MSPNRINEDVSMRRVAAVALLFSLACGCRHETDEEKIEKAIEEVPQLLASKEWVAYGQQKRFKRAEERERNTLRLGETLKLSYVTIEPVSVELKRAVLTNHMGREKRTTETPVFVLTVLVTNISDGQVFRPLAYVAEFNDNAGNRAPNQFGNEVIAGSKHREEFSPGETVAVKVAAIPENDSATSFTLEARIVASNKDGDFVPIWVEFSRDDAT